jgi:rare lipoprotein A
MRAHRHAKAASCLGLQISSTQELEHILTKIQHTLLTGVFVLLATGCSTTRTESSAQAQQEQAKIVKAEALHSTANLSYKVACKRYYPRKSVEKNFSQTGRASWYGPGFHGRKTSSGERFDMNALTAAHRTLPIPSYARVTNLANGKTIVVRINDRGPFHGKRVLDLSKGAAKALGFIQQGSTNVRIEALKAGDSMAVAANDDAAPQAVQPEANLAQASQDTLSNNANHVYMSLKSLQEAITAEPLMRKVAMSRTQSPLAQENGVMMLDLNNDYWRSLSALLNHAKDEAQAKEEVI